MNNFLRWLIIGCLFLSSNIKASDDAWNFTLGLSIKQLSLDVYEINKTDPEGILTQDFTIAPELGLESGITYFTNSYWGYKYAINFGAFEMNTQEVALQDIDLNTSADGYFLYAMPVLVYDFLKNKNDQHLLLGVGFGIGYLNASGNIVLTESSPQITHNFDFSELTVSYGVYFDYSVNSWSYNISLYGPEVIDQNYEYNLFNFSMTIRKKFSF